MASGESCTKEIQASLQSGSSSSSKYGNATSENLSTDEVETNTGQAGSQFGRVVAHRALYYGSGSSRRSGNRSKGRSSEDMTLRAPPSRLSKVSYLEQVE
ncbi:hypothetical protein CDL15_Pgr010902 [Punica granatum]|uniref:Uncharacterized protein n=1 Tax=Punica granatum TaxID=22663 RepID=A0A218XMR9_PUNGR|nr:hypothetical protein CDL15_Pgr010902 [Punica granatum]PKI50582.1 hypothetical protein CRG98_029022 [Punica granatum]